MKRVWENPEIQSINRLPMRSPLIPYENAEKAERECAAGPEACKKSSSLFYKDLDGQWDFCFLDSPEIFPDEKTEWKKITVPGSWSVQGYGFPHYTNVQMPFDCAPPFVPEKNPTGYYRLRAEIPSEWNGRRIVLHIGSAESVVIVFVNGIEAGLSKDARLPCEFDITPYINGQTAEITLKVAQWSDASYVEDQDQWWFGGIHRSVYLYSTEKVFIQDVKALTRVTSSGEGADKKTIGIIPLEAAIAFSGSREKTQTELDGMTFLARYTVRTLEGEPACGKPGAEIASGEIPCGLDIRNSANVAFAEIKIENPALWSNETPSLYIATVTLCEKNGRHIESVSFTCGFKTVRIKNRELLFNGKKIYIRGVNRHEHNERSAKTLTTEEMARDILTLKKYNFNAVRTCHYPNDERWYDLCDRYGVYILDEANIENHAFYGVLSRSEEWLGAYITRVQRMAKRDKNHACVFGWSLGNESGNGLNHAVSSAWLKAYDDTRIVHYEGFARPGFQQDQYTVDSLGMGKGLTDIVAPMYPAIDLIVDFAKNCADYRPLIMCEYSHAMGNANGSLADYWRAIESAHGLQGGFIWDWIDQGIASFAPEGKPGEPVGGKFWKYGGDFGDTPTDYDFCLNGLNFPDQTPKPAMEECKRIFSPARMRPIHADQGIFEVENKFGFISLDVLKLNWTALADGIPNAGGTIRLKGILPGERLSVEIPEVKDVVAKIKEGSELILRSEFVYARKTFWADEDEICGCDEFTIISGGTRFARGAVKISREAEELSASFEPTIFRAFTENEGIKAEYDKIDDAQIPLCFWNKPTKEWLDCALQLSKAVKNDSGIFSIESERDGLKFDFGICSCKCEKISNGESPVISLSAVFNLTDTISEYPRVGLTSAVSSEFTTVKWYGRGPHECYSDRKYSALKGLYTKNISDMNTPYIVPQENGARCGVKYLELSGGGKTIHIQSDGEFSFTLSPYSARDLFACRHTSELTDLSRGSGGKWILTIDAAQRGVGTGACGPDTLEEYRVRPGTYRLDLKIW